MQLTTAINWKYLTITGHHVKELRNVKYICSSWQDEMFSLKSGLRLCNLVPKLIPARSKTDFRGSD